MSDKMNDGRSGSNDSAARNVAKKHSSRRGFIKKALISAVAVATTAKLAEKTASLIAESDHQKEYLGDVLPGDRVMSEREYVLMSDSEKKNLVRSFEKDYRKRS